MKNFCWIVAASLVSIGLLGGCRKPYDTPQYQEVKPNETAFVISLEGDTNNQAKFDSLEKLQNAKVAAKRIQITHRWNQTDRWEHEGTWIPNVMIITVDRAPVTRQWTAETSTGTSASNQALWAESKDSIGFSTGISITAMVQEDDTATFLYRYQGKSISDIMDSEVRARIQTLFADFAAQYEMSDLRNKKVEMINYIRYGGKLETSGREAQTQPTDSGCVAFFKERGITVTTIGQFGGFCYENKKVQESIDAVFIAQREKEVAKALLEAQSDKNKRLEGEGEGEASKLRKVALGKKDAAVSTAEGEALAIKMVAEATKLAGQNPLFLQMRILEVQQKQLEKWDGKFPITFMGGSSPSMLLNMPMPTTNSAN